MINVRVEEERVERGRGGWLVKVGTGKSMNQDVL